MKKIILFSFCVLLAACNVVEKENPDKNFGDFYTGPVIDDADIDVTNSVQSDLNSVTNQNFVFSGEDEDYSCTIVCEAK